MRRARAVRDESGATLLLALIFVVVTGVTAVALLSFTGNGLLDLSSYLTLQAQENAAATATNVSVETVRYTDPSISSGSEYCPPYTASGLALPDSATATPGGATTTTATFWVTCSAPDEGLEYGPGTRTVYFYTCDVASCNASTPYPQLLVSAEVEFVDGTDCNASALAACGEAQNILSWTDSTS